MTTLAGRPDHWHGALEDLREHRFGRLLVVNRLDGAKKTTWQCRCDCGAEKAVGASELKTGKTKSCGCLRSAVARGLIQKVPRPSRTDPIARFWAKVDRRGPGECWPWLGCRLPSGHGQFWDGTRLHPASRFALQISGTPVDGLLACHRCNNPPCVNPEHLYAGTYADNSRDAVEAGSFDGFGGLPGEDNYNAVLKEDEVYEIKRRYVPHDRVNGGRALAREFGVSAAAVGKILRGEAWTHV